MLRVEQVSLAFRGIRALREVSFEVERGSVTALIGPNGAGKTTIFNCINRVLTPDAGTISFDGTEVTTASAARLAGLGVSRTFQHAAVFTSLSVRDNVRVGTDLARRSGRTPVPVDELLELLELDSVALREPAGLPLGTLKRVELARALASRPALLLLDEPAGGLTHEEVAEIRDLLLRVRETLGMTLLLVEHHVNMVMSMSDRIVVMSSGEVIARGTPAEVRSDPAVVAAYLGAAA